MHVFFVLSSVWELLLFSVLVMRRRVACILMETKTLYQINSWILHCSPLLLIVLCPPDKVCPTFFLTYEGLSLGVCHCADNMMVGAWKAF